MSAAINWTTAIAAAGVVGAVVAIALCGWAGQLKRLERIGLCLMAAGMAWAGPSRLLGYPAGLGDLIFVLGILTHLAALYGPALWRKADALDGLVDGRLDPARLHAAAKVPRATRR